jgi:hypothetical protein
MGSDVDILIVVDCQKPLSGGSLPAEAVTMYASEPSTIVRANSQGTSELWVQVPPETNLRWRAVPLQISQGAPEGQRWQVMITQVKLWGANGANQLKASDYLQVWFTDAGTGRGPGYSPSPGQFTFSPGNDFSESNVAGVQVGSIADPFIQATCFGEMSSSQYVAYSFTCTVYNNGQPYATVTWDPYVTIYQG